MQAETAGPAPKKTSKGASTIRSQVSAAGPSPKRPGRNPFTKDDDDLLLWWIEHAPMKRGNVVYKELTEYFPSHSWQSWRERWVKTLSKERIYAEGPKPSEGFDVTKVKGWKAGIARPTAAAPTQPRKKPVVEVVDDFNSEDYPEVELEPKVVMQPAHVNAVRERLDALISADDADRVQVFAEIVDRFPERSVEDFQKLFYEKILPEHLKQGDTPPTPELQEASRKPSPKSPEVEPSEFSVREQRALFAKFDHLLFADSPSEQLEICVALAEEVCIL
ncbi:hypothetical protein ABW20_dc0109638 [Dactylellina cionopaga]|nr:hypothetical protein ABW20_dc0109638 [Dactylellina cionopaga]